MQMGANESNKRRRYRLYDFMLSYAFTSPNIEQETSAEVCISANDLTSFLGNRLMSERAEEVSTDPALFFFVRHCPVRHNVETDVWIPYTRLLSPDSGGNSALHRIGRWAEKILLPKRALIIAGLRCADRAVNRRNTPYVERSCMVLLTSDNYRRVNLYMICFVKESLATLLAELNRHRDQQDLLYIRSCLFAPAPSYERRLAEHADTLTARLSASRVSKFFYKLSEQQLVDIDKQGSELISMCHMSPTLTVAAPLVRDDKRIERL